MKDFSFKTDKTALGQQRISFQIFSRTLQKLKVKFYDVKYKNE